MTVGRWMEIYGREIRRHLGWEPAPEPIQPPRWRWFHWVHLGVYLACLALLVWMQFNDPPRWLVEWWP